MFMLKVSDHFIIFLEEDMAAKKKKAKKVAKKKTAKKKVAKKKK